MDGYLEAATQSPGTLEGIKRDIRAGRRTIEEDGLRGDRPLREIRFGKCSVWSGRCLTQWDRSDSLRAHRHGCAAGYGEYGIAVREQGAGEAAKRRSGRDARLRA